MLRLFTFVVHFLSLIVMNEDYYKLNIIFIIFVNATEVGLGF